MRELKIIIVAAGCVNYRASLLRRRVCFGILSWIEMRGEKATDEVARKIEKRLHIRKPLERGESGGDSSGVSMQGIVLPSRTREKTKLMEEEKTHLAIASLLLSKVSTSSTKAKSFGWEVVFLRQHLAIEELTADYRPISPHSSNPCKKPRRGKCGTRIPILESKISLKDLGFHP
jgi:hypothetical protein